MNINSDSQSISLESLGIIYKQVDVMTVASQRFRGKKWITEIGSKLVELEEGLTEYIAGPAFVRNHWGTNRQDGTIEIEYGFPVSNSAGNSGFDCSQFEGGTVLSIMHKGSANEIDTTRNKLVDFVGRNKLLLSECYEREILFDFGENKPSTTIEIQFQLLPWLEQFSEGLDRELGSVLRNSVLEGLEAFHPQSGATARTQWVSSAISRLDDVTDESQKHDILTECGHRFPEERLRKPRAAYERTKDIDEVLVAMAEDPWFGKPHREENTIYSTKGPINPEGYENATSNLEKKCNYCFCGVVRESLMNPDIDISPTYCYCGAGWYRGIWERITGKPVKVEILESILNGDNVCSFAIHLFQ